MAAKMKPDFLIQKRVAEDNRYAASAAYANKLDRIKQNTAWFESKTKYAFADGEKRSEAFIKQEMECANAELKTRRKTRLKLLYESEARAYEEELGRLGLAIQRMHF
mmetsp:Transcript_72743/g.115127  ORF Transcript_72743/g.115127 Transcript_72743/m.115127 type:complete len:107 (+) Transcript_72743:78-398(+)|eukprot:CAMPEP_0169106782 /NCGR_PEP_ID=MMETSP1015-20121227/24527_1 /TAXON_ID=342587 /ORGANISM="Karlodinium micrum, Strain CCMP2283" /LENGTH=106 /DNA_ID=CAMNT_0009168259 /DNA_START=99 /DNA_END=419 /DNA_ORIENTATION=-